ncbi:MAG: hybrid sensor histidine kinase/response regulator [Burkholderiales bacterium]|nr:hybrid sensor histidine kinase/response regulator [Burkholderiales bacterium]
MLQLDQDYSSSRSLLHSASADERPRPVPAWAASQLRPQAADALDPDRLARLKRLQLESLAHSASRLTLFVPLAAGFVGFTVWDAAPGMLVLGWIAAIVLVLVARWQYSGRALRSADSDVGTALGTMAALSFVNGLIQGVGVALFFPGLGLEQKAIVTMIMVCLSAGAVSANAGYSRAFFAWAIPMFAALAFAWARQGDVPSAWIAALLVLFPIVQSFFVRDNERVLSESFGIRYQNEQLIRELEVQRQAVARERDRAEDANRAKSRFLASASHDLRQPLHTLSLYSAALGMRKTDERTQQMAREIGTAITSLGSLLDALLDISKLDAEAVRPEPSRFALDALASRVAADFRPIAEAKGLALELDAPEPLTVDTDAVLLERVLRNLLDNAVKYTRRGAVRLELHRAGERALLSVRDSGPGIPRAEQARVFEEFYQLSNPERDRARGIGLGLAIVRRLTDLLGIELRLESEPGSGATFHLALPVAPEPARAGAAAADDASRQIALPEGLRVLVTDDEGSVREGMRTLLETWGCAVRLASGTAEALAALDAAPVDLIIADHRLRGRETGVELVRRAREKRPGLPALLITGDTASSLHREAGALGLALLHKPVSDKALREAIAGAVGAGVG